MATTQEILDNRTGIGKAKMIVQNKLGKPIKDSFVMYCNKNDIHARNSFEQYTGPLRNIKWMCFDSDVHGQDKDQLMYLYYRV